MRQWWTQLRERVKKDPTFPDDPQEWAKLQRQGRRVGDVLLGGLSAIMLAIGAVAWRLTGNVDHFYGGLFFATLLIIGLIYNHFVVFSSRQDLAEAKRRFEKDRERGRASARWNGWLMVIVAPVFLLMGIGIGYEQQGLIGAVGGASIGVVFGVGGWMAIRWGRRGGR